MAGLNHVDVKASGEKGLATEWNKDHQQKGNHDCEKFQHLNHVVENRVAFPAGPVEGQIIYRTDEDILYIFDGINWVNHTTKAEGNELVYNYAAVLVGGEGLGLLVHSPTDWTMYSTILTTITGNAGVAWANAAVDLADLSGVGKVCDADGTNAIICDHNSNATFLAVDSGDTWVAANTDPVNITKVYDLSYPTTSVAVAAVQKGAANKGIFICDPSGGAGAMNWVECTSAGPAVDVMCVDMIDGSDGICVDTNKNIWTTIDGGVNWVDSGQDTLLRPEPEGSIIALSTTEGVMLNKERPVIVETFNTATGGTGRMGVPDADETGCYFTNLCRLTNGNIYFAQYSFSENDDRSLGLTLYISKDDGVTWIMRALGTFMYEVLTNLSLYDTKAHLSEYDTNKLLLLIGRYQLMKIDES